jgi:DNA-binding transcriptional MerR regulator
MAAEYATIRDVAAHFRVSVSTVRNWIRAGTISPDTYIKISGTYRFNLDLVEAALLRASETTNDNTSMENDE